MRKGQKQDIIKILQSLYDAHREIEEVLGNNQSQIAKNLLCDCQECAIELGNVIEEVEGEGIETISYLEKYCNVLFHYHNKVTETKSFDKKNAAKIAKALDKQVKEIESSIQNDIPERQEIVFMPYKASMWDSLESVYLAAKEDPDCDVYCVPIPYFDKNMDGTLGQMHYEIDQYPKNIEVVNRLSYKLEERRPDIIYIHNPYDECNHVTCVHPDYFSSRLKQYTDKLVYIPYFVLPEIEPDDQIAIEGIKKFCFLPGTIHANQVIVQSEKMRQIYINEYLKAAKVYGLTGEHLDRVKLEEKFLGLGSPKFDKILNTHRESLDIPEEWRKIIEKEDGRHKKIIFYNTSINALLKHDEQMLVKMESVFQSFKERQKEVALLWRPHPLIPSTIQSIRPKLWEKYSEIVEKYRKEGWGIYDDSPDLDRAIVLSDGYYGDQSSVVEVYKKMGKPVMIQRMLITPFDESMLFHTYKIVSIEKKTWISTALFNGLFTLNLENGEIEWEGKFPDEEDTANSLYKDYKVLDKKIYFAPTNAKNIMAYDTIQEEFTKIPFDIKGQKKNGNDSRVIVYGRELIFIGVGRTNVICKYSVDKKELVYIDNKVIENIDVGLYGELYGSQYCIKHNFLYIPLMKGGCALKIDLKTNYSELLKLQEEIDFSFRMAINIPKKNVIWFIDKNGGVVEWSNNELVIVVKDKDEEEYLTCDLDEDNLNLFSKKIQTFYKSINISTLNQTKITLNSIQVLDVQQIGQIKYYLGVKTDGRTYCIFKNSRGEQQEIIIHPKSKKNDLNSLKNYNISLFKDNKKLYYERNTSYQYINLNMYIDEIIDELWGN